MYNAQVYTAYPCSHIKRIVLDEVKKKKTEREGISCRSVSFLFGKNLSSDDEKCEKAEKKKKKDPMTETSP